MSSDDESGSTLPFVSTMSNGLPDNVCRLSFIEKFWSGKSAFFSTSTTKCLASGSDWQTTENDSNNSSAAKSECLIILSLSSGLQRRRIDQENKRVFYLFIKKVLQNIFSPAPSEKQKLRITRHSSR
ncbi:hypothetical protein [Endozoicomonas sp. ISHI1]|uniref:hypothetical protein n=1 Tax=Endozoicomonas sp. ISHI1 TaxID=2825882 RepID=UPI002147C0AF|nr:hypothetical protein [Endozoicomonas sp. ISHI1]